jgi:hypothetical protein
MYGIGSFAREFLIREALTSDMLHSQNKPRAIVRQLAKIVAKHLFVQISGTGVKAPLKNQYSAPRPKKENNQCFKQTM